MWELERAASSEKGLSSLFQGILRGTEAAESWCRSFGVTTTFSQKTDFQSVCPFLSEAQTWRDKVADWVGALSVPRLDGSHIVTQLELFCLSRIKCLCGQINAQ